jgi:hypothetical protein
VSFFVNSVFSAMLVISSALFIFIFPPFFMMNSY